MMETVGKLNEFVIVEWRIKEFFSLPAEVDRVYKGPVFSFAGAVWRLRIYPNGRRKDIAKDGTVINSEGFIGIYLFRTSPGTPINLDFYLGLKTLDEKINPVRNFTCNFEMIQGFGNFKFINRSTLFKRMYELVPSGVLTVVCKIKYPKTADISNNTATEKCSYCKSTLDAHEDLSSHQQKCMDRAIKCPECSDVVTLKNWYDHKCQKTGAEAFEKLSHDFGTIMLGDHRDIADKVNEDDLELRSILAA